MNKEQYRELMNLCDEVERLQRINFLVEDYLRQGNRNRLGIRNVEKFQKLIDVDYVTSQIHTDKYPPLIYEFTKPQYILFKTKLLKAKKPIQQKNDWLMKYLERHNQTATS